MDDLMSKEDARSILDTTTRVLDVLQQQKASGSRSAWGESFMVDMQEQSTFARTVVSLHERVEEMEKVVVAFAGCAKDGKWCPCCGAWWLAAHEWDCPVLRAKKLMEVAQR